MVVPYIQGFATGGGLIVAIGAQNAFLFSQSIKRNHHLIIAAICIAADILLIGIGVSGVGSAVASSPDLARWAAWAGAAFLGWYGWGSFRSAMSPGALETDDAATYSMKAAVLATLGVTFLNPHVYIDTILLMGSVSGQFPDAGRILFWAGASTASFCWFVLLAAGGRLMAPLFQSSSAWRVLDACVCLTMWTIAWMLVSGSL